MVELPPSFEDQTSCFYLNNNVSSQLICDIFPDLEFALPYFILLGIISVIGIIFVEWCNHRFEKWASPLADKFMARRQYVLERKASKKAITLIQDVEQQKANTHPLLYCYQVSYRSEQL